MPDLPRHHAVVRPGPLAGLMRAVRERAMWTQHQLAMRSGVNDRTIRDIERGTVTSPRQETLELLFAALGLSPAEREAVVSVAAQPPAPPGDLGLLFTGRNVEIKQLNATLPGSPITKPGTTAVALTGPPGCGKTALAQHWASMVAPLFAGGTHWLNLPGSPGAVPAHSLVIADGAGESADVVPVLADAGHALVLVTSRDRLAPLAASHGITRISMGPLTPADAAALLAQRAGRARLAAEPAATRALISRCGSMPAALLDAAQVLAAAPQLALREYLDQSA